MTDKTSTPKPRPFTPARNHIAGRDARGDICMNEGRGTLVALGADSRYLIEERMAEARPGRFKDQCRAALHLLDREADVARAAAGTPRPNTPPVKILHGQRITVKRCCNGCDRELGDATQAELGAAIAGTRLPDVRNECGCTKAGA